MNPISTKVVIGTLGELFLQLELLKLGIQASLPLKDSGNDLIAIKGEVFRAIQVKTCYQSEFPSNLENLKEKLFHLLAIVIFPAEVKLESINWTEVKIYMVSKDIEYSKNAILSSDNILNMTLVNNFFR
jgi:hypothetical protein